MNVFYATFIPGLQDFIAQTVKERLSGVKIHKLLDGAVIFETETSYDKLNFFCFNNLFAVISSVISTKEEDYAKTRRKSGSLQREDFFREEILYFINENHGHDVIYNNSKNIKTFRIVISNENIPAAIDEDLRTEAEKYISRISGLKVNRTLPDTEYWFLYRREEKTETGQSFFIFMKRLTMRPSWDKTLQKGELPPPLAWALCRLAGLTHKNKVLDPFCGYGSIVHSAVKHFHITNFIACDINKKAAVFTAARFKKRLACRNGQPDAPEREYDRSVKNGKTAESSNLIFYNADFNILPSLIKENSIDVIITDPPWGQYQETSPVKESRNHNGNYGNLKTNLNYKGFCIFKMFDVFDRLLKESGRAVVLYANDDNFSYGIPGSFRLLNRIPVLLSGRKAVIYILNRKTRQTHEY